jgi:hypothetical protein
MSDTGEVTGLLGEIGSGKKDAMNQLLPLVYDELHRLAQSYCRRERGEHTLQPTALVHEAYIRMVDQKAAAWGTIHSNRRMGGFGINATVFGDRECSKRH